MKVLVCGGRDFNDWEYLEKVLDDINAHERITVVVNGHAKGADSLARKWGVLNGCKVKGYPANWYPNGGTVLDRGAGPKRNAYMLADNPDISLVIAFPGDKGTANMTSLARKKGIDIIVVPPKEG